MYVRVLAPQRVGEDLYAPLKISGLILGVAALWWFLNAPRKA